MSGITLTPVVTAPVSAVAEVASNASQGFGDALGAAMAQLAANSSVMGDAALKMPDRGQGLTDETALKVSDAGQTIADESVDADILDPVVSGAPNAYAQLMMAMAQLMNHGNPKALPGPASVASDASLLQGGGRTSASHTQDMAARGAADERDVLLSLGSDASAVGLKDVGERHSGADFAALLQDLPVAGSESKVATHELTQAPSASAAMNHGGVIEIRQQEGRKELVISTPVSSAGWGDELGSKTLIMVRDGQQSAEMQLNPPNLGPLEVRLSVQNDQTSLIFVSAHASVRDAIQSALPRLSGMLAESGLSMGSVQVGDQSLAQQQQQRDGGNSPRRFARSGNGEADGVAAVADAIPMQRSSWRLSMFV